MNSLLSSRPSHRTAPRRDSNRAGPYALCPAGRRTPALRPRRPRPTTSATRLFCSNSWCTGPESLLLASPAGASYGCDLNHVPEIRDAQLLAIKLSDRLNPVLAENLRVSCLRPECQRSGFEAEASATSGPKSVRINAAGSGNEGSPGGSAIRTQSHLQPNVR